MLVLYECILRSLLKYSSVGLAARWGVYSMWLTMSINMGYYIKPYKCRELPQVLVGCTHIYGIPNTHSIRFNLRLILIFWAVKRIGKVCLTKPIQTCRAWDWLKKTLCLPNERIVYLTPGTCRLKLRKVSYT